MVVVSVSAQMSQDELKATKTKIEGLQRLEDTHLKQLKFFEHTRYELEQQIENMHADNNTIKNGTNAKR